MEIPQPHQALFLHDSKFYSTDMILSYINNINKKKPVNLNVETLFKYQNEFGFYDNYTEDDIIRVANAKLKFPIIVSKINNELAIIDGAHRLKKAYDMNIKSILAYDLPFSVIEKCELKHTNYTINSVIDLFIKKFI